MDGSHLAQIVDKTIHSPADIVEKVRAAYASPKKTGAPSAKAESHGKD
jgi:hypothetical protein